MLGERKIPAGRSSPAPAGPDSRGRECASRTGRASGWSRWVEADRGGRSRAGNREPLCLRDRGCRVSSFSPPSFFFCCCFFFPFSFPPSPPKVWFGERPTRHRQPDGRALSGGKCPRSGARRSGAAFRSPPRAGEAGSRRRHGRPRSAGDRPAALRVSGGGGAVRVPAARAPSTRSGGGAPWSRQMERRPLNGCRRGGKGGMARAAPFLDGTRAPSEPGMGCGPTG